MKKSWLSHQSHTATEQPSWIVTRGFLVLKAEVCLLQAWEVLTADWADRHRKCLLKWLTEAGVLRKCTMVHAFFFFLLWILTAACRILVPGPGIESRPPELGAWSLSHWTTREVLVYAFLHFLFRPLLCRWSDVELTGVSGTHKAKSSFKSWPWRLRNRVHAQGTAQRAGCRLQVLRDPRKEKAPSGVWSKNAHWEKGLSWAPSMSRAWVGGNKGRTFQKGGIGWAVGQRQMCERHFGQQ